MRRNPQVAMRLDRTGPKHVLVWLYLCVWCLGCGPDYAELANIESEGAAIVCFGDSITRGYGASLGKAYPDRLGRLLRRRIVNAGRDGDTTERALSRIEDVLWRTDPRLVIIELGGNDLLKGVNRDITFQNLDDIVQHCIDAGAMVVILHAKYGLFADPYADGFESTAEKHLC